MCGRFALYTTPPDLALRFGVPDTHIRMQEVHRPRYNIAPSTNIMAVRLDKANERELVSLKWGLVPHWSVEPKTSYSTINAKAETVDSKPMFRSPFKHSRCLIPADGWIEWAFVPGQTWKQPWYFKATDGQPLAFAGLWDRWQQGDQVLETCTIIVCDANSVAKPVHDRMPVVLGEDDWADWLDPSYPTDAAKTMLRPCPDNWITSYKVGRAVSLAKNEGPDLIRPGE